MTSTSKTKTINLELLDTKGAFRILMGCMGDATRRFARDYKTEIWSTLAILEAVFMLIKHNY